MVTKICFVCEKEKELKDFYKHSAMADGHLNKCKECTKKQSKKRHYKKSADLEWKEKEKERSKEKYHRLNYKVRQLELNKAKKYKNSDYKRLNKIAKNKGLLNENEVLHHWNYNLMSQVFAMNKDLHRYIHTFLVLNKQSLVFWTTQGILLDTVKLHRRFLKSKIKEFRFLDLSLSK